MTDRIESLLKMLDAGRDSALLRFSLGNEFSAAGDYENAATHLARCLELDRSYSAAWKLLGKSLVQLDRAEEAIRVWTEGIGVAEERGDRQAAKEMTVFLRRIQKQRPAEEPGAAPEAE